MCFYYLKCLCLLEGCTPQTLASVTFDPKLRPCSHKCFCATVALMASFLIIFCWIMIKKKMNNLFYYLKIKKAIRATARQLPILFGVFSRNFSKYLYIKLNFFHCHLHHLKKRWPAVIFFRHFVWKYKEKYQIILADHWSTLLILCTDSGHYYVS